MSTTPTQSEHNGNSSGSLANAVRSIAARFTGKLAGPAQVTKTQIVSHLEIELDVSQQQADQLFEQLQESGVVTRGDEHLANPALLPDRNSQRWRINADKLREHKASEIVKTIAIELDRETDDRQSVELIRRAIAYRATDIHLSPFGDECEVRFRIDGRLEHYCRLSQHVANQVIGQLKLMAEFDIAEPFSPQEGRLELPSQLIDYDVRMTLTPVIGGDAIALRILHRSQILRSLDSLGLSVERLKQFEELLNFNEGLVLVTGPSGAGKTTTLYSLVHALDNGNRNIVTIEDPVEYRLPGFVQMEVDRRHEITMNSGLRTLLRMDPDIVLLGEIRDRKTAEAAMRAASTGKYVFTSFHTRDVASVVTGLRDLDVDSRSLAGSLRAIISQRLVRQLCGQCRRGRDILAKERELFERNGFECPDQLFESVGCEECRSTGFQGRTGVFEIAVWDNVLAGAIEGGASELELRRLLREHRVQSLSRDAIQKAAAGITDIREVSQMSWVELANDAVRYETNQSM